MLNFAHPRCTSQQLLGNLIAAGVPAVDIIDFAPFLRGYHHTAQDTLDRCSPDTLAVVGRVVLATLAHLDRRVDNQITRSN